MPFCSHTSYVFSAAFAGPRKTAPLLMSNCDPSHWDISVVPVPEDPATWKSFVYRVEGNRITLRDLPPAGPGP